MARALPSKPKLAEVLEAVAEARRTADDGLGEGGESRTCICTCTSTGGDDARDGGGGDPHVRALRRQGQGRQGPLPRPQQAVVGEVPLLRLVGNTLPPTPHVHLHLLLPLHVLLPLNVHLHLPSSYFDTGVYLKLYPPGEQNMEEGRVKDALGKEVGWHGALGRCRTV